jgi:hypothetical protein
MCDLWQRQYCQDDGRQQMSQMFSGDSCVKFDFRSVPYCQRVGSVRVNISAVTLSLTQWPSLAELMAVELWKSYGAKRARESRQSAQFAENVCRIKTKERTDDKDGNHIPRPSDPECPVCKKELFSPSSPGVLALTSCGHLVCRLCVENHAEGLIGSNAWPRKCPVCKQESDHIMRIYAA